VALTLASWVANATAKLDSDTARLDAELLLCHVLKLERTALYTWPNKPIDAEQVDTLALHLQERAQGKPIAYITGVKEFWSLPIHVTPNVLIPRADTETLVEYAIEVYQHNGGPILEMGTGSGAIAIALASELNTHITASDESEVALQVAKDNAQRLVPEQITFELGDWGQPFADNTFKLIVSNPPYIAPNDPHLQASELRHEPHTALVSARDGLADIEQILRDAKRIGTERCTVILEHGYEQGAAVRTLMRKYDYKECVTKRDLSGQERITAGITNS